MSDAIVQRTAVRGSIAASSEREQSLYLLDCLSKISALSDLSACLDAMLDLMIEVAQAGSATYFAVDNISGEAIISAVRGDIESQHLIGLRLKSNKELLNPDASGAHVISCGELYDDPRWLRAASPQDARRMQSMIILPVRTPLRNKGVIHLFDYQVGDLAVLQHLAGRLGYELDQREQLLQLHTHSQRLTGLLEAITQMTGILDRSQLLYTVTEQASRLLEAERSTLFIVDPDTHQTIYNVTYQASEKPDSQDARRHSLESPAPVRRTRPLNYLTTSAVSAPLTNKNAAEDSGTQSVNLGGLMALNKRGGAFQEQDAQVLEMLAVQASSLLQVAELYESSEKLFMDAIRALVAAIDAKDPGTQGHSARVSDYSVLIAQGLGLSSSRVNDIRISSLLHDLGKIGIPEAILNKQDVLTVEERRVIYRHPLIGANILGQVEMLSAIVPGILEHHERLDGSGYPKGLVGEEISMMGRIIMTADVFDAMTSPRPYRPALSVAEALDYLVSNAGILFDKRCIQALIDILDRSIRSETLQM